MPRGATNPVLVYRNPADDRRDGDEEQGRLIGYVAVAAVWGIVVAGIAVLFIGVSAWALLLSAAG